MGVLLGNALEAGRGVRKDAAAAEKYYARAVERGHVPANRALALLHGASGRLADSLQWHMKGAMAGDAECMAAIAEHYLTGRGVPTSRDKGKDWLDRALDASKHSGV